MVRLWHKVIVPGAASPVIGFAGAFVLLVVIYWLFHRLTPGIAHRGFRTGQLFSGTWVAFTHGANDAQKTMGIVVGLLVSSQALFVNFPIQALHLTRADVIPDWVVVMACAAIAFGTLAGGWRIVKTMGMRITKLRPVGGFCAESAAAISLLGTAMAGIPVSTTHTIAGGIMGVGSVQRFSAVRWGVAKSIIWAWILTIPIAGIVSALCFWVLHYFFPAA